MFPQVDDGWDLFWASDVSVQRENRFFLLVDSSETEIPVMSLTCCN